MPENLVKVAPADMDSPQCKYLAVFAPCLNKRVVVTNAMCRPGIARFGGMWFTVRSCATSKLHCEIAHTRMMNPLMPSGVASGVVMTRNKSGLSWTGCFPAIFTLLHRPETQQ